MRTGRELDVEVRVGAEIDDVLQRPLKRMGAGTRLNGGVLRPDHDGHAALRPRACGNAGFDFATRQKGNARLATVERLDVALEEIRIADEIGDKTLGRAVIDVARRADLQDTP